MPSHGDPQRRPAAKRLRYVMGCLFFGSCGRPNSETRQRDPFDEDDLNKNIHSSAQRECAGARGSASPPSSRQSPACATAHVTLTAPGAGQPPPQGDRCKANRHDRRGSTANTTTTTTTTSADPTPPCAAPRPCISRCGSCEACLKAGPTARPRSVEVTAASLTRRHDDSAHRTPAASRSRGPPPHLADSQPAAAAAAAAQLLSDRPSPFSLTSTTSQPPAPGAANAAATAAVSSSSPHMPSNAQLPPGPCTLPRLASAASLPSGRRSADYLSSRFAGRTQGLHNRSRRAFAASGASIRRSVDDPISEYGPSSAGTGGGGGGGAGPTFSLGALVPSRPSTTSLVFMTPRDLMATANGRLTGGLDCDELSTVNSLASTGMCQLPLLATRPSAIGVDEGGYGYADLMKGAGWRGGAGGGGGEEGVMLGLACTMATGGDGDMAASGGDATSGRDVTTSSFGYALGNDVYGSLRVTLMDINPGASAVSMTRGSLENQRCVSSSGCESLPFDAMLSPGNTPCGLNAGSDASTPSPGTTVTPFGTVTRFRSSFSRIRSLSRRPQRSSLSNVPEEEVRCPPAASKTLLSRRTSTNFDTPTKQPLYLEPASSGADNSCRGDAGAGPSELDAAADAPPAPMLAPIFAASGFDAEPRGPMGRILPCSDQQGPSTGGGVEPSTDAELAGAGAQLQDCEQERQAILRDVCNSSSSSSGSTHDVGAAEAVSVEAISFEGYANGAAQDGVAGMDGHIAPIAAAAVPAALKCSPLEWSPLQAGAEAASHAAAEPRLAAIPMPMQLAGTPTAAAAGAEGFQGAIAKAAADARRPPPRLTIPGASAAGLGQVVMLSQTESAVAAVAARCCGPDGSASAGFAGVAARAAGAELGDGGAVESGGEEDGAVLLLGPTAPGAATWLAGKDGLKPPPAGKMAAEATAGLKRAATGVLAAAVAPAAAAAAAAAAQDGIRPQLVRNKSMGCGTGCATTGGGRAVGGSLSRLGSGNKEHHMPVPARLGGCSTGGTSCQEGDPAPPSLHVPRTTTATVALSTSLWGAAVTHGSFSRHSRAPAAAVAASPHEHDASGPLHGCINAALAACFISHAGSTASNACQPGHGLQVACPSEVTLGDLLGKGSMGSVFKGTWRGEVVAIKTLKHSMTGPLKDEQVKQIEQEAALGICLDHPNIVATYAAFTTVSAPPCHAPPVSRQPSAVHSQGQLHLPALLDRVSQLRMSPYNSPPPAAPHAPFHPPPQQQPAQHPAPLLSMEPLELTHGSPEPRFSAYNTAQVGAQGSFSRQLSRQPSNFSRMSPGLGAEDFSLHAVGSPTAPRGGGWCPANPYSRCGSFGSVAAGPSYGNLHGNGFGFGFGTVSANGMHTPMPASPRGGVGGGGGGGGRAAGAVSLSGSVCSSAVAAPAGGGAGAAGGAAEWKTFIVMELCPCGSLRAALDAKRLHDKKDDAPKLHEVLPLAWEVACALQYLHANGVVHGDLKAANVMLAAAPPPPSQQQPSLTAAAAPPGSSPRPPAAAAVQSRRRLAGALPTFTAKVADFSNSYQVELTLRRMREAAGSGGAAGDAGAAEGSNAAAHSAHVAACDELVSPTHAAPELFEEGARPTLQSDIYSLGVVLWELYGRKTPYVGLKNVGEVMRSKRAVPTEQVLHIPDCWPREYAGLCRRCWLPPAERPSLDDVVTTLVLLCRTNLPHVQLCYPTAITAEQAAAVLEEEAGEAAAVGYKEGGHKEGDEAAEADALPEEEEEEEEEETLLAELGVGGAAAAAAAGMQHRPRPRPHVPLTPLSPAVGRARPAAAPPLPGISSRISRASSAQGPPAAASAGSCPALLGEGCAGGLGSVEGGCGCGAACGPHAVAPPPAGVRPPAPTCPASSWSMRPSAAFAGTPAPAPQELGSVPLPPMPPPLQPMQHLRTQPSGNPACSNTCSNTVTGAPATCGCDPQQPRPWPEERGSASQGAPSHCGMPPASYTAASGSNPSGRVRHQASCTTLASCTTISGGPSAGNSFRSLQASSRHFCDEDSSTLPTVPDSIPQQQQLSPPPQQQQGASSSSPRQTLQSVSAVNLHRCATYSCSSSGNPHAPTHAHAHNQGLVNPSALAGDVTAAAAAAVAAAAAGGGPHRTVSWSNMLTHGSSPPPPAAPPQSPSADCSWSSRSPFTFTSAMEGLGDGRGSFLSPDSSGHPMTTAASDASQRRSLGAAGPLGSSLSGGSLPSPASSVAAAAAALSASSSACPGRYTRRTGSTHDFSRLEPLPETKSWHLRPQPADVRLGGRASGCRPSSLPYVDELAAEEDLWGHYAGPIQLAAQPQQQQLQPQRPASATALVCGGSGASGKCLQCGGESPLRAGASAGGFHPQLQHSQAAGGGESSVEGADLPLSGCTVRSLGPTELGAHPQLQQPQLQQLLLQGGAAEAASPGRRAQSEDRLYRCWLSTGKYARFTGGSSPSAACEAEGCVQQQQQGLQRAGNSLTNEALPAAMHSTPQLQLQQQQQQHTCASAHAAAFITTTSPPMAGLPCSPASFRSARDAHSCNSPAKGKPQLPSAAHMTPLLSVRTCSIPDNLAAYGMHLVCGGNNGNLGTSPMATHGSPSLGGHTCWPRHPAIPPHCCGDGVSMSMDCMAVYGSSAGNAPGSAVVRPGSFRGRTDCGLMPPALPHSSGGASLARSASSMRLRSRQHSRMFTAEELEAVMTSIPRFADTSGNVYGSIPSAFCRT